MFEPIPLEEFGRRTGTIPLFSARAEKVVSLRDVVAGTVSATQVMPKQYLDNLIRNIVLEGNGERKPYKDCCKIELARMDPGELKIGQTFIERKKYLSLLENFGVLFDNKFCMTRGVAKCGAMIIFGKTADGIDAIAHYLPPIIEVTANGARFLLDGVHRNFLAMKIGTTMESVLIKGAKDPLPCGMQSWSKIRIVDEKPPRNERFLKLVPEFFRNLKYTGIDG